jgi:hypothetical protein
LLCVVVYDKIELLQVHFSEQQFERNRSDNRRLLCRDAVPDLKMTATQNSIYPDGDVEKPGCSSEINTKKRKYEEIDESRVTVESLAEQVHNGKKFQLEYK